MILCTPDSVLRLGAHGRHNSKETIFYFVVGPYAKIAVMPDFLRTAALDSRCLLLLSGAQYLLASLAHCGRPDKALFPAQFFFALEYY